MTIVAHAMQTLRWCAAVAIVLVASGCPDARYRIEPGTPVLAKTTGPLDKGAVVPPGMWVTGTYTLRVDATGYLPALYKGERIVTGGACLLYQAPNSNEACDTADDCKPPVLDPGKVDERMAHPYCLKNLFKPPSAQTQKAGVENRLPERTCWYKHADDWCRKAPFEPLDVGIAMQMPRVPARPFGKPVFWRIVTCQNLNLDVGPKHLPGCAEGTPGVDAVTWPGPIESF